MRTWILATLLAGCSFETHAAVDGAIGSADAGIDGAMVGGSDADAMIGASCYGVGLIVACFPTAPTGEFDTPSSYDTSNASNCDATVTGTNVAGICVKAAGTIQIGDDFRVTGSKPLLLVATDSITVDAKIDVSSGTSTNAGAGANLSGCDNGHGPDDESGGAGGSFGGKGGDGGSGGPGFPQGSRAGNPFTPTVLRGGCKGQDGAAATGASGGNGGGAVYLIAARSIELTDNGVIDASGAGGKGGAHSILGGGGGGGGGAGGMIGLDAPTITNGGVVFANGGGGGEGGDSGTSGNDGKSGGTSNGPTQPGVGGNGNTIGGGAGANGSSGTSSRNGATALADGVGAGGGGGGAGVIVVFGATLTGSFAPAL